MAECKLHKQRYQRILEELAAMGLGKMLITSPVTIEYLTGYFTKPFEQLFVLYVSATSEPKLVYSITNSVVTIEDVKCISYGPLDDPVSVLAPELESGELGIDQEWTARFLLPLMKLRTDITPVLSSKAVERVRLIKDLEEQELMRQASLMDDGVFAKGFTMFDENKTELMMSNQFGRLFEEAIGKHMGVSMVSYGANAANPHHWPAKVTLKEGDCVLVDSGKALNKYMSDMTRTAFFRKVSQRHRDIYAIVLEANLAGIAAAKEGRPAGEVDKAARDVITRYGYGEYFIHRVGHGIGREGHEYPSISSACEEIMRPGMCFSVEPGIYLPGEVGIRIEDLVMITDNGTEVLNHYPKELRVLE